MFPKFLYLIGSAFCAQNPSHSFFYNGQKLPLDARETGMYLGFLAVFIFWLFKIKKKPIGVFPLTLLIPVSLSIIYFTFDGFSSMFGAWWVTNFTRLFSGLFFGQTLAILVLLVLSHSLWSNEISRQAPSRLVGARILDEVGTRNIKIITWPQWLALALVNLVIFTLFWFDIKEIFYAAGYLIIFGLILNVFLINLAALATIFSKKIGAKKTKIIFIVVSLVLLFFEFSFLIGLRRIFGV